MLGQSINGKRCEKGSLGQVEGIDLESFEQENRKARPRSWDPTEILKYAHGLQGKVVTSKAQQDRGRGGLARDSGSKDVALE